MLKTVRALATAGAAVVVALAGFTAPAAGATGVGANGALPAAAVHAAGSALRLPLAVNRSRVFWTGPDGHLRQSYSITEYNVWQTQEFSGGLVGALGVTHRGVGNSGRFDVFGVSPGGHLFQRMCRDGHWGRWLEIALGSTWTPGVSALVVTTGSQTEYHVFGHDPAGELLHAYWSNGQWHVQNLGGRTGGTPAAAYHDGHFDVFAISPAGNVYQRGGDSGTWTSWRRVMTGFAAGTGLAALWDGSRLRVIGLGHESQMLQAYRAGSTWTVQDLGGRLVRPLGVTYDNGFMRVYGRTARGVFYSVFRPQYGWSRWIRVAP
jgi:hypothetical protein